MFGRSKKGYIVAEPARLGTFIRFNRLNNETQKIVAEVLSGHPKKEVLK